MTKWIIAITLIISGLIFGYMYTQMSQISHDDEQIIIAQNPNTIRIVDGYKDGIHRLSGTIKLPHSCYEVTTDAKVDEYNPGIVTLTLTSKDNILDQPVCAHIRTRYPFETIVETQKEISIKLVVDGVNTPTVLAQTEWQNPSGSIINTDPSK